MFNKLRRKFIVTAMVLLTSIVVLICTAIYITTKNNTEDLIFSGLTDNLNDVKMILSSDVAQSTKDSTQKDIIFSIYDIKTERAIWASTTDIDEDTILSMINEVINENDKNGKGFIEIDESTYAYMYKDYGGRLELVFKDSTLYSKTMHRLILISIAAGFVGILILYMLAVIVARKAIKPVEEAYNSQKRFIADASHELKTPLAVVKTNIELLNANKEDTIDNQMKWVNYISFQTDRMSKLVTNLLYLAKADNNEELGVRSTFNMSDVVMNQLLSFEAVLYESNLELKCNVDENIIFYGDKEGISQLVGILLDNAIKHSFKNCDIDVTLTERKHRVYLSVTNKGEVIPQEDIDKIFERFYRVDKSRAREKGGYGLGLSIAKSIVKKCNGKIKVESANNETTFMAEFPSISEDGKIVTLVNNKLK